MLEPVEALQFKVWRNYITAMIQTADYKCNVDNSDMLHGIQEKLVHFEDELPKLKEATTILELALWKKRINENSSQQKTARCWKRIKKRQQCCVTYCADVILGHVLPFLITRRRKKIKTEDASIRQQCRITCGADVIIGHVLPYLL